jgi:serine/threonine protein kinase
MIGREIGNFRILEKLGEGGMGVVYKGIDTGLDREVAIKVLTPELANNPELVERFRTEAKAQATLNHTNIATLYAFLQVEGQCLIVMEYLDGRTFEELLMKHGKFPPKDAVSLIRQALMGLGFAHRRGIVHRDVKPSNLMLTDSGIVKVMDFGIAKLTTAQSKTRTGMRMGTLPYMSPEQIRSQPVDARSDIYSLGITLYQLLTALLPFRSDSDYELMRQHISEPPPPPTSLSADVPKGIEQCVMKALAKDPAMRFQSAEKFGAALEYPNGVPEAMLLEGAVAVKPVPDPVPVPKPVPPPPPPGPTPSPIPSPKPVPQPKPQPLPPAPRRKSGAMPIVAGALAVVLVAGLAVAFWPKPPKPVPPKPIPSPVVVLPHGGNDNSDGGNTGKGDNGNTGGHGAENLGGGTSDHVQRVITPPPAQPKPNLRGDKVNPYTPEGNTQPVIQKTEPGGQEYQRAVASFNQGQYFFPTNDSALYWDQVAIKAGNANAKSLEPQISKKYVQTVQQLFGARNYPGALQVVDTMLVYYPGNRALLSDRQKIVAAQSGGAGATPAPNNNGNENYQPPQQTVQPQQPSGQGVQVFSVRHRHIEVFTNNNRGHDFYCFGTLTIQPTGAVIYRCIQSNDPQRGCNRDSVAFPPGTLKEVTLKGNMLHLRTASGNWDFLPNQNMMDTSNAYQSIMALNGKR